MKFQIRNKSSTIFMAFVLTMLLSACGGGGGGDDNSVYLPPEVFTPEHPNGAYVAQYDVWDGFWQLVHNPNIGDLFAYVDQPLSNQAKNTVMGHLAIKANGDFCAGAPEGCVKINLAKRISKYKILIFDAMIVTNPGKAYGAQPFTAEQLHGWFQNWNFDAQGTFPECCGVDPGEWLTLDTRTISFAKSGVPVSPQPQPTPSGAMYTPGHPKDCGAYHYGNGAWQDQFGTTTYIYIDRTPGNNSTLDVYLAVNDGNNGTLLYDCVTLTMPAGFQVGSAPPFTVGEMQAAFPGTTVHSSLGSSFCTECFAGNDFGSKQTVYASTVTTN